MTLNPVSPFPSSGGYVLKLHRDAQPAQGELRGRVVHLASGDTADFASSAQLVEWLQQHAALTLSSHPQPGDLP
jgi:hypothetical protein